MRPAGWHGGAMRRLARIVIPRLPHHVTQRGNNRQDVFFVAADPRDALRVALPQTSLQPESVQACSRMRALSRTAVLPVTMSKERDATSARCSLARGQSRTRRVYSWPAALVAWDRAWNRTVE